VRPPYLDLVEWVAGTVPMGVPLVASTATDVYGWIQTWGPCTVRTGEDANLNGVEVVAAATGLAAPMTGAETEPSIGAGLSQANTGASCAVVYLKICP
jgi:hypothetical protein